VLLGLAFVLSLFRTIFETAERMTILNHSHKPVIWMVDFIPIFALVFGQVELSALSNRLFDESECLLFSLIAVHLALLASITMRASVIESEIAERTRGLRFCNSIDSTRANLTAAPRTPPPKFPA
jgi:hypothetical protein